MMPPDENNHCHKDMRYDLKDDLETSFLSQSEKIEPFKDTKDRPEIIPPMRLARRRISMETDIEDEEHKPTSPAKHNQELKSSFTPVPNSILNDSEDSSQSLDSTSVNKKSFRTRPRAFHAGKTTTCSSHIMSQYSYNAVNTNGNQYDEESESIPVGTIVEEHDNETMLELANERVHELVDQRIGEIIANAPVVEGKVPKKNNDFKRYGLIIFALVFVISIIIAVPITRTKKIPSPTTSITPSLSPSIAPTLSLTPTISPTANPTLSPTTSNVPTLSPSIAPTLSITPTVSPSTSNDPTFYPSIAPTLSITPTISPTTNPTLSPSTSINPSQSILPTLSPSSLPTSSPTESFAPSSILQVKLMHKLEPVLDNSTFFNKDALLWMLTQDTDYEWHDKIRQRYLISLLYFEMGGEYWTRSYDFLKERNECEWNDGTYGVFCEDNMKVTKINLVKNNLKGTIPPNIVHLKHLKVLNLSENRVTGSIPSKIGGLIHLEELKLYMNNLNGTLSYDKGNLTGLKSLEIELNDLSGNISFLCNKSISVSADCNASLSSKPSKVMCDDGCCSCPLYSRVMLTLMSVSGKKSLMKIDTPQYKTYEWMLEQNLDMFSDKRIIQRYVIALLYYAMGGDGWKNKFSFLSKNKHECNWNALIWIGWKPIPWCPICYREYEWKGVTCDDGTTVSKIAPHDNRLNRNIPHEIGELENLKRLDFHHNFISGSIPYEVRKL